MIFSHVYVVGAQYIPVYNLCGLYVKARPLEKSLNTTSVISGDIAGRTIELTIGMSKVEWERTNCGVFLYWRGRLIEVGLADIALND